MSNNSNKENKCTYKTRGATFCEARAYRDGLCNMHFGEKCLKPSTDSSEGTVPMIKPCKNCGDMVCKNLKDGICVAAPKEKECEILKRTGGHYFTEGGRKMCCEDLPPLPNSSDIGWEERFREKFVVNSNAGTGILRYTDADAILDFIRKVEKEAIKETIGNIGAKLLAKHSPQVVLDAFFDAANEELEKQDDKNN